jgi:hypothetical protein
MKVTLNAARAARGAICEHYGLHRYSESADPTRDPDKHTEWCPRLIVGEQEGLTNDQWVISWEEGVEREWVYDYELREAMEKALDAYRDTVEAFKKFDVKYRLEAVNHWCVGIYVDIDLSNYDIVRVQ